MFELYLVACIFTKGGTHNECVKQPVVYTDPISCQQAAIKKESLLTEQGFFSAVYCTNNPKHFRGIRK